MNKSLSITNVAPLPINESSNLKNAIQNFKQNLKKLRLGHEGQLLICQTNPPPPTKKKDQLSVNLVLSLYSWIAWWSMPSKLRCI
uniref:Uncharacterized protein n=1 Tax=Arundo donax TaxID=35708 RepID=A0A0A8YDB0_ARUDO